MSNRATKHSLLGDQSNVVKTKQCFLFQYSNVISWIRLRDNIPKQPERGSKTTTAKSPRQVHGNLIFMIIPPHQDEKKIEKNLYLSYLNINTS